MDNIVRTPARKPAQSMSGVNRSAQPTPQPIKNKPKSKLFTGLAIGLACLLAAVLVWLYLDSREPTPMSDRYQAVFLDDGKVFFGRLEGVDGSYLTLNEAYYTQTQSTSPDGETQLQPAGGVNLVKVGDEVYGPENSMVIRADQVLFWQNLTTDNQIVKAIENQKD